MTCIRFTCKEHVNALMRVAVIDINKGPLQYIHCFLHSLSLLLFFGHTTSGISPMKINSVMEFYSVVHVDTLSGLIELFEMKSVMIFGCACAMKRAKFKRIRATQLCCASDTHTHKAGCTRVCVHCTKPTVSSSAAHAHEILHQRQPHLLEHRLLVGVWGEHLVERVLWQASITLNGRGDSFNSTYF